MKNIKSMLSVFNIQTFVVTGMAVGATYACIQHQWYANFPLTLIATAVIFPIVFFINGAYKRREIALR